MKLLELELQNFRGAPDGVYSFRHPQSGAPLPLVLVAGGAASGKTSFLEAIVALKESVGSYGAPPSPGRLLRSGAQAGYVKGTWLLTPAEMVLAESAEAVRATALPLGPGQPPPHDPGLERLFAAYSRDPGQCKFEYFDSGRRLTPRVGMDPDQGGAKHLRLTRRPDKYAGLEQVWLRLAAEDGLLALQQTSAQGILLRADQRDSLAPYKATIAALAPTLRLAGVGLDGDAPRAWFEQPDGATVELYDLSDGEQQAVLLAAMHHHLGLQTSVVLLDMPELFQDEVGQARLLQGLAGLMQKGQLIAATGAGAVVEAAAGHPILRLDRGQ